MPFRYITDGDQSGPPAAAVTVSDARQPVQGRPRSRTRALNELGVASRKSVRCFRSDLMAEVAVAAPPFMTAMLGVGIVGRAALHAWRLGDMTDSEAAAFVDEAGEQLLAGLAADAPR